MSVYFDFNASSPVRREVIEKMVPHFRETHGNPSSTHFYGQRAKAAVEEARGQVAALIGAEPSEIIFLSGGTEANNMVIWGIMKAGNGALITSKAEHPAVFNTAMQLQKDDKDIFYLSVNRDGLVSLDELREIIESKQIALVSIMTANNETGTIQPVDEIARICKLNDLPFHTDAAQAVGKIPFQVKDSPIAFATLAAHKMGGPIGIGALYIRSDMELDRLFEGGSQEVNRRPGTEAVPLIVGFGEACRISAQRLQDEFQRIKGMRDFLEQEISAQLPEAIVNSSNVDRLPNTSNIAIPGISSDMLVIRMDLEGFAISSGSACHSGRTEPSRVLKEMGLDELANSSVRISIGPDTSEGEVADFVKTFVKVLKEIKIPGDREG